jgi:hypothetical protein
VEIQDEGEEEDFPSRQYQQQNQQQQQQQQQYCPDQEEAEEEAVEVQVDEAGDVLKEEEQTPCQPPNPLALSSILNEEDQQVIRPATKNREQGTTDHDDHGAAELNNTTTTTTLDVAENDHHHDDDEAFALALQRSEYMEYRIRMANNSLILGSRPATTTTTTTTTTTLPEPRNENISPPTTVAAVAAAVAAAAPPPLNQENDLKRPAIKRWSTQTAPPSTSTCGQQQPRKSYDEASTRSYPPPSSSSLARCLSDDVVSLPATTTRQAARIRSFCRDATSHNPPPLPPPPPARSSSSSSRSSSSSSPAAAAYTSSRGSLNVASILLPSSSLPLSPSAAITMGPGNSSHSHNSISDNDEALARELQCSEYIALQQLEYSVLHHQMSAGSLGGNRVLGGGVSGSPLPSSPPPPPPQPAGAGSPFPTSSLHSTASDPTPLSGRAERKAAMEGGGRRSSSGTLPLPPPPFGGQFLSRSSYHGPSVSSSSVTTTPRNTPPSGGRRLQAVMEAYARTPATRHHSGRRHQSASLRAPPAGGRRLFHSPSYSSSSDDETTLYQEDDDMDDIACRRPRVPYPLPAPPQDMRPLEHQLQRFHVKRQQHELTAQHQPLPVLRDENLFAIYRQNEIVEDDEQLRPGAFTVLGSRADVYPSASDNTTTTTNNNNNNNHQHHPRQGSFPSLAYSLEDAPLENHANNVDDNGDDDVDDVTRRNKVTLCEWMKLRRRRFWIVAATCLLVVLLTVTSTLLGIQKNRHDESFVHKSLPTLQVILESVNSDTVLLWKNPVSPQGKALEWLENDYTENRNRGNEDWDQVDRLVTRYALAVLYFATDGDGDSWNETYSFLSSFHECNWTKRISSKNETEGVICDVSLAVSGISLGTLLNKYLHVPHDDDIVGAWLVRKCCSFTDTFVCFYLD